MRTNRPQRSRVLAGERHQKTTVADVGLHKLLDRVHRLAVYFTFQFERCHRGDSAPLPKRLAAKRFIVTLHLVRSFNDGRRAFIRAQNVAGRMLVGCRKDVHTGLVRMTPGLFKTKEIMLGAFPSCGKRHDMYSQAARETTAPADLGSPD